MVRNTLWWAWCKHRCWWNASLKAKNCCKMMLLKYEIEPHRKFSSCTEIKWHFSVDDHNQTVILWKVYARRANDKRSSYINFALVAIFATNIFRLFHSAGKSLGTVWLYAAVWHSPFDGVMRATVQTVYRVYTECNMHNAKTYISKHINVEFILSAMFIELNNPNFGTWPLHSKRSTERER